MFEHIQLRRCVTLPVIAAACALASTATARTAWQDSQPESAPAAAQDEPTIADGQALMQDQQWTEAADVFKHVALKSPDDGQAWFFLGYCRHAEGELTRALMAHMMSAEMGGDTAPIAMYNAACVYSLWNKSDKAFEWLNKAIGAGFNNPNQLKIDSDMDNIRNDPRFEKLPWPEGGRGANRPRIAVARNPQPPAEPKEIDPNDPRHQLNFWLGSWRVSTPDGEEAARDSISFGKGGGYIIQNWRSEGMTGMSLSFYNPAKKKWEQIWADNTGRSAHLYGELRDGAMYFDGTCTKSDGAVTGLRMKLAPTELGTVRMIVEERAKKEEPWGLFFDCTYSPLSMPAKKAEKEYDSSGT